MKTLTAVFMGNQCFRIGGFIQSIHIILQFCHMAVSLPPGIVVIIPILQNGRVDSGNGLSVHKDLSGIREGTVRLPAPRHALGAV